MTIAQQGLGRPIEGTKKNWPTFGGGGRASRPDKAPASDAGDQISRPSEIGGTRLWRHPWSTRPRNGSDRRRSATIPVAAI